MSFIKFIRIFLLVLIILGIGLLATQKFWVPNLVNAIISFQDARASRHAAIEAGTAYRNISYEIEGQKVLLSNGHAETEAAPGSASKTITEIFGNGAVADLNGDGLPDVTFLLTQTSGGSGTFYYVAVALKTDTGYAGTNAVLLGDRIAPQSTLIRGIEVVVNYADRNPGEPMTTEPSVGKSMFLKIDGSNLVEAK